jgi:hypothetical protein
MKTMPEVKWRPKKNPYDPPTLKNCHNTQKEAFNEGYSVGIDALLAELPEMLKAFIEDQHDYEEVVIDNILEDKVSFDQLVYGLFQSMYGCYSGYYCFYQKGGQAMNQPDKEDMEGKK